MIVVLGTLAAPAALAAPPSLNPQALPRLPVDVGR